MAKKKRKQTVPTMERPNSGAAPASLATLTEEPVARMVGDRAGRNGAERDQAAPIGPEQSIEKASARALPSRRAVPRWAVACGIVLLLAAASAGFLWFGPGSRATEEAKIGDFRTAPAPPILGSNQVEVSVTDVQGRPLGGLKVFIDLTMPNMVHRFGGQAEELDEGVYGGAVPFYMPGTWLVRFTVEDRKLSGTREFKIAIPGS